MSNSTYSRTRGGVSSFEVAHRSDRLFLQDHPIIRQYRHIIGRFADTKMKAKQIELKTSIGERQWRLTSDP